MTDLHNEQHMRLQKYHAWTAQGHSYPNDIQGRVWIKECRNQALQEGDDTKSFVIAGRIMLKRNMGKASFMTLEDSS